MIGCLMCSFMLLLSPVQGVMQRLGVGGGGRNSVQRSNSLGNNAAAVAGGAGAPGDPTASVGPLSNSTAIGALSLSCRKTSSFLLKRLMTFLMLLPYQVRL